MTPILMGIATGTRIGPYQVDAQIGAGGMGEVYRATDTSLKRAVALKVLPDSVATDPVRLARFQREAEVLAALNHPNIATVYGMEETPQARALVMELVEGRTLDRVIPTGGLRVNEALRYALEVAEALTAAHAQGIVHRDLKPSNVMITKAGRVKVLDFGLATVAATGGPSNHAATTTIGHLTLEPGAVVGTVAYMSPEQAQGLPVDARSDIFSFGVLLYEMLTGVRPFAGDTKAATLAAVINQDPRPARERADVPPELDRLVSRCLRKDRARRPQTMADVHVVLVDVKEDSESGQLAGATGSVPAVHSRRGAWSWPVLAAGVLLTTGALGWVASQRAPAQSETRTFRATNYSGVQSGPALSPDGTRIAFAWDGPQGQNIDIYVQLVDGADALRLTQDPAADTWPTWSPDGRQIAFRRGDAVYTISALGGSEHKIGSELPHWAGPGFGQMSWSPDGAWLAVPTTAGLFALPEKGGQGRPATAAPGALESDTAAAFSPDGRALAFFRCGASIVSCRILLQPLSANGSAEGEPRRLFDKPFRAGGLAWSRDGQRLVFFGSPHQSGYGVLWQVNVRMGGPPERVDPTIQASIGGVTIVGGRLANQLGLTGAQIWQVADGQPAAPLTRSAVWDFNPRFSPDGARFVFQSGRSGDGDQIFVARADGSDVTQVTGRDVLFARNPEWSPDGKWLTFDSQREDGNFDVVVMDAGGGPLRRVTQGHNDSHPAFSRDGRRIWFESSRGGQVDIWSVPFEGGRATQFTFEGRAVPQESLDGTELHYSDGRGRVYTRPTAGGPERLVASDVLDSFPGHDGLYVVRAGPDASGAVLHLVDRSGADRIVAALPGLWRGEKAFSVSPDRRILYSYYSANVVIQMVDGFR